MSVQVSGSHAREGIPQRNAILVRCRDVGRTFGSGSRAVVAVHDATCSVRAGMQIALTGPSGSGKSTLVHLMAGLDTPTAGELTWPALDGDPHGRPGVVGVVFQGPSLLGGLSVLENVALPLQLAGTSAVESLALAAQALDAVRISELALRLPDELSGGQAQRAAVARVLAGRPRLILADEPTGTLDHEAGFLVISVLLEAADRLGAALIVSTHDQAVVERFPDQWSMRDGRLQPTDDRADRCIS
ncbi:MAG: ABC transporter ATP-binding protein [Geodermatophilaceae bacterium]